jgi:hypothetical protein
LEIEPASEKIGSSGGGTNQMDFSKVDQIANNRRYHLDGKRSGRRNLDAGSVAPNRSGNFTGAKFGIWFGKFTREGSLNGSFTFGAVLVPLQRVIASVELIMEKLL